jgi:hypothetical protein
MRCHDRIPGTLLLLRINKVKAVDRTSRMVGGGVAVPVGIGSETFNLREGLVQRVGCLAM